MVRLLLALGFGLLFGSLSIWAIQKMRLHSALQLANLQMNFVASVSHELRTPITAILSAAENLRDGMVTKREDIVEQSTIMAEQAVQLCNLVDQVLLFASPAQSGQLQSLGEVQVHEIVEDALRCTASVLQESGFTVEQQIEPGLPQLIGDLGVLSQCLQNLIVNAAKYGAANKWIRISATMDERNHELQIRVQDRGMGINQSDLPHIFEPFYRSPQAVTAHIKGTGLGLSIAKRSAEAFGGTLGVSSEVGVGTVFTLSLPPAHCHSEDRQVSDAPRIGIPT
jgi:signal transduction histidine kinase